MAGLGPQIRVPNADGSWTFLPSVDGTQSDPLIRSWALVSPRLGRLSLSAYAQLEDVFPPLGLEYVVAALRPYAQRIDLINFRHQRPASTQPFLTPETDLVCYSINWRTELEMIRDDINALPPGVLTILGGRTATEDPRYWLDACPNADAVVCGDGEQAIAEIAQGRPWSEIAGLAHRGRDGQVIFNPPRANVPLDDNLMPARDLRRHPYYLTSKGVSTGIKIDQVAGSRGCPFHCKFCNFSINPWGVKRCWAPRSPESIVREIEQIEADLVLFVDDVFTYQPDRVAESATSSWPREYGSTTSSTPGWRSPTPRRAQEDGAGGVRRAVGGRRIDAGRDAQVDGQGIHHRTGPPAVPSAPQVEDGHQRLFHRGQHRRNRGADALHRDLRAVDRRRPDPPLPVAQRAVFGPARAGRADPGYHIGADGFVYSDAYSAQHIARLRKQIDRQFYTPWQVARVVIKLRGSSVGA